MQEDLDTGFRTSEEMSVGISVNFIFFLKRTLFWIMPISLDLLNIGLIVGEEQSRVQSDTNLVPQS